MTELECAPDRASSSKPWDGFLHGRLENPNPGALLGRARRRSRQTGRRSATPAAVRRGFRTCCSTEPCCPLAPCSGGRICSTHRYGCTARPAIAAFNSSSCDQIPESADWAVERVVLMASPKRPSSGRPVLHDVLARAQARPPRGTDRQDSCRDPARRWSARNASSARALRPRRKVAAEPAASSTIRRRAFRGAQDLAAAGGEAFRLQDFVKSDGRDHEVFDQLGPASSGQVRQPARRRRTRPGTGGSRGSARHAGAGERPRSGRPDPASGAAVEPEWCAAAAAPARCPRATPRPV